MGDFFGKTKVTKLFSKQTKVRDSNF